VETDLVAPSAIESRLDELWEKSTAQNKARASLFNLIFYTRSGNHLPHVRALVSKVIEKFPSRILFILKKEEPSPEIVTRVSVLSSSEEADFACDLIEIEATAKAEVRIPFLLLPHLLPDLPILSFWADTPSPGSPLFDQLEILSERMIFDSALAKEPVSFARELLRVYQKCDISDLTWARLQNWRRLLSTTFHSQERLEMLYDTKEVIILYNELEQPAHLRADSQAFYLKTWLFCQLGWKKEVVSCKLLAERQELLPQGAVLSIDIVTSNGSQFSFGRDLKTPHLVSMRFSSLYLCDIPLKYFFPSTEMGHSLISEINRGGTSAHLIHILKTLC